MILADKIIKERKKLGISQEELAEKLGVSRQSVSKWEGAQSIPDINRILAMSEIFGVSTDYLLNDKYGDEECEIVNNTNRDQDVISKKIKVTIADYEEYFKRSRLGSLIKAISISIIFIYLAIIILLSDGNMDFANPDSMDVIASTWFFITLLVSTIGFMISNHLMKKYKSWYEKGIETEYGLYGILKKEEEKIENKNFFFRLVSVALCFIGLIAIIVFSENETYVSYAISFFMLSLGLSISLLSYSISMKGRYNFLLKEEGKKMTFNEKILKNYWLCVAVLYIIISFITRGWVLSWLVLLLGGIVWKFIKD